MKAIRRFSVRTVLPEPIAALGELASNLRWSWHEPTRRLFSDIDPERWLKVRQDPIALLSDLTPDELARLADDHAFVDRVRGAKDDLDRYLREDRWYQGWAREQQDGAPAAIACLMGAGGVIAAAAAAAIRAGRARRVNIVVGPQGWMRSLTVQASLRCTQG